MDANSVSVGVAVAFVLFSVGMGNVMGNAIHGAVMQYAQCQANIAQSKEDVIDIRGRKINKSDIFDVRETENKFIVTFKAPVSTSPGLVADIYYEPDVSSRDVNLWLDYFDRIGVTVVRQ